MGHKKLMHGGIAVLITVAVIALTIIINYAVSAIVSAKSLYLDMTKEQIYSISDSADEIYSDLDDQNFEIIFFTEFDKMQENSYQKQVYSYCKLLSDKYDNISIKYIDSISNPEQAAKYQNTEVPDLDTTDVVVTNSSAWQAFKIDAFFTIDSSSEEVFAFNIEYKLCTAMMQMGYDSMLACFTTGHGETTDNSNLCTLLTEAGFEVRNIDLAAEDIPDETRILIINNPIYDFGGAYDDANEIDKLDKYLDNQGNVMIFEDPDSEAKLTNLSEFLYEWGIQFVSAQVRDYTNSVSTDGTAISAKYTEEGTASGLNKSLRELDNPPKTIVFDSMPIDIVWKEEGDTSGSHNSIETTSVLTTYNTAKAYSLSDNSVVDDGELNLMTVSAKSNIGDNNETYYNYLLACGTSAFVDDTYLNGNTYGNSDIIYEAIRTFTKKMVPVDLDFKVYDDETLDITTGQATAWTVVFTFTGPVIFGLIGTIVYIRRKHS